MSEELKPCPFCGGEAVLHRDLSIDQVWCSDAACAANGPASVDGPEHAIKGWNTAPSCDAMEAKLRKALESICLPPGEIWRHKKRGTEYEVIGAAKLQFSAETPIFDEMAVIVYRGNDGDLWVRPLSEFLDGRFVKAEQTGDASEKDKRIAALEAGLKEWIDALTIAEGMQMPDSYLRACYQEATINRIRRGRELLAEKTEDAS